MYFIGDEPSRFYRNLMVGDFNGDGLDDFLDLRYNHENHQYTIVDRVFISNGAGFEVFNGADTDDIIVNKDNLPEFRSGDFDGDGKTELVMAKKEIEVNYDGDPNNDMNDVLFYRFSEDYPYMHLVFGEKMYFGNTDFDKSVIVVSDFNGDGRSDIFRTAEYGGQPHTSNCFIYSVDIPTNQLEVIYGTGSNGYPTTWHQLYPGDFNGDGITDLLTYTYGSDNPTWEVACFNGQTGFNTMTAPPLEDFNLYDQSNSWYYSLNLADYNGDGKTDIMQLHKILNTTAAEYIIYYSNGNTFEESASDIITIYGGFVDGGTRKYEHVFPYNDFNGDGHGDIYLDQGVWGDKIYLFDIDNDFSFVNNFKNGFGQITKLNYSPLTNHDIYTKGTGPNPTDVIDIQPAFYVVELVVSEDGIGGFTTIKYEYKGAKLHKKGKGFLGFQQLTTSNYQNTILKSQAVSTFELDPIYYFSWLLNSTSSVKKNGSGLKLINETTNEPPVIKDFWNKRIFYYTPRTLSKEFAFADGTIIRSVLSKQYFSSQDIEYGNLTTSDVFVDPLEMTFSVPTQAYHFSTLNYYTYLRPDLPNWLIGRVDVAETKTWSQEDGTTIFQKKSFTYKLITSLVQTSTLLPNNVTDFKTVTSYVYDLYGNVTSIKTEAPDFNPAISPRTTEYQYSADYQHRFQTETKNMLNGIAYTTTSFFDVKTGLIDHTSDINSLATYYKYDGFGRTDQVIYPDQLQAKSRLYWSDGHADNPVNGLYYTWSQRSGEPDVRIFYSNSGAGLRTVAHDFDGAKTYQDKGYNDRGLPEKESLPYYPGDAIYYTQYVYDELERPVTITLPDGTTSTTVYLGNSTKTTNALNQTSEKKYNAAGWLTESMDATGKSVKYDYFSDGKLKSSFIVGKPETTVSVEYNSRRQRSLLHDPNYGTVSSSYNPFDELVQQVSPRHDTTTYQYDGLGRMISQKEREGSTNWVFDGTAGKKGTLKSVHNDSHKIGYTYDNLLRTLTETETIGGENYQTAFTYDALGRLKNTTHPSGFTTTNFYNSQGELYRIRSAQNDQILWQTDDVNLLGQITEFTTGNSLHTINTYHPKTARLTGIITQKTGQNPVQDLYYGWDAIGNLHSRIRWINYSKNENLIEEFGYDNLNRLKWITLNEIDFGFQQYDPDGLGNMVYKKSDGQVLFENAMYGEGNDKPHALTSAITSPGVFPSERQDIKYNSFDKVYAIIEGDLSLSIIYGVHHQRIEQKYAEPETVIRKLWAGACEYITGNSTQTILTYLAGPSGVFALHSKNTDGTEALYYIHKDHLSSWNTITDESGNLIQELSFDAWGVRRDPATWRAFTGTPPQLMFDRGFTGHEHLDGFQLINMNGRVYDPVVSRMLSPDNYIQSPDFSQSFNRYSYCYNNPLLYTDPDGNNPLLIAALIGGATNLIIQSLQGNIHGIGDAGLAFGVGALAGLGGAFAGGAFAGALGTATSLGGSIANGALVGASGGFAGGFIGGSGNTWMNGGNIGQGLQAGLVGGGYGALGGALIGGVTGGIQFEKQMGFFRKGNNNLGIESGDAVPATDEFLNKAQKAWYKDAPMNKINIFSVENVPDKIFTGENSLAGGVTIPIDKSDILTGISNVYFNKNVSFTSAKQLFINMGHEFVHVSQIASLSTLPSSILRQEGFRELMEFHAYNWEASQGNSYLNSFTKEGLNDIYIKYPAYFKSLTYSNFDWTRTANYTYPF